MRDRRKREEKKPLGRWVSSYRKADRVAERLMPTKAVPEGREGGCQRRSEGPSKEQQEKKKKNLFFFFLASFFFAYQRFHFAMTSFWSKSKM